MATQFWMEISTPAIALHSPATLEIQVPTYHREREMWMDQAVAFADFLVMSTSFGFQLEPSTWQTGIIGAILTHLKNGKSAGG